METRLEKTRLELEQSRAECGRLAQIRDDVEAEVRELTASLFQVSAQAHRHLSVLKTELISFVEMWSCVCVCSFVRSFDKIGSPSGR